MTPDDVRLIIRQELQPVLEALRHQKEWYSVEEFAQLTGRAVFTVRQWCNLGRINAEKSQTRAGGTHLWAISREEYLRFQQFGLLPVRRPA